MKFFRHLITITRHRHAVIRNAFSAGILWQGLFHDLSKYSPTEFFTGVKHFTDGKRSPNEHEREQNGYSRAWMHHKGRNRHHFEYWVDINPETKNYEPVKMPLRYLAEMFCDRLADRLFDPECAVSAEFCTSAGIKAACRYHQSHIAF